MAKQIFTPEELRYLKLLAQKYPTVQDASTEIINLQAILNLPKGTEHFISDIHGEYEAFLHILNSCSGVIKEKIDEVFASSISKAERDQLATLIYYPQEKLELVETCRKVRAAGVTIIIIEHDIKTIMSLCDKIFILHRGEKLVEGTPDEVANDKRAISAYLGEDFDNAESE